MGSTLNARQSDRTNTVHHAGRRHGAAARIYQKSAKNSKGRPRTRPATASRVAEEGLDSAHLGSDFHDFLAEEGLLAEVQTLAAKKLIAYKILEVMRQEHVTKDALAKRMKTSRAALDRLLDPTNPSVTLATLGKAVSALHRTLHVELRER